MTSTSEKSLEESLERCAGCERAFSPDALAEGVCAHCWAAARRIRAHGHASRQAQCDAARFVVEHHLPHSLAYSLQILLEDAAENALHKMVYTRRSDRDDPALFYKEGRTYHPIAPLDYYPAPGVWLVEWKEHSRVTAWLSRLPVPDPIRLAAARRWEDQALAAVREQSEQRVLTTGDVVRIVLDTVGAGSKAD